MKKIYLVTAATTLIFFAGCAGMEPKQMKQVTQEQTLYPNLHGDHNEQSRVLEGALKQVHAQVKSMHKNDPDIFLYYGLNGNQIGGRGDNFVPYSFYKPNILTIDGGYIKDTKYRYHNQIVTLIDETNALLPTAIVKVDQMCFDYKNSFKNKKIEIVKSSLSDLLPQGLKDSISSGGNNNQVFNIEKCRDFNFLTSFAHGGIANEEFTYNNDMFRSQGSYANFIITGNKVINLKDNATELSISDVSYNFYGDGFEAANKDLLVSIDWKTDIQITNKTDEMITLNQLSEYYGEDISSKSYNLVLAPHSVQTIKSQIIIPWDSTKKYRSAGSYIYKAIKSNQGVQIGVAVGYTLNGNKTLTKLEERKIK